MSIDSSYVAIKSSESANTKNVSHNNNNILSAINKDNNLNISLVGRGLMLVRYERGSDSLVTA